jgi:hypothetical protein
MQAAARSTLDRRGVKAGHDSSREKLFAKQQLVAEIGNKKLRSHPGVSFHASIHST